MKLKHYTKTVITGNKGPCITMLMLVFVASMIPLSANAFELSGQKTAQKIHDHLNAAIKASKNVHGWSSSYDCPTNKEAAKKAQSKVRGHGNRANNLYKHRCAANNWRFFNEVSGAMMILKKTCAPINCPGHNTGRCNKQRKDMAHKFREARKSVPRTIFNSCR